MSRFFEKAHGSKEGVATDYSATETVFTVDSGSTFVLGNTTAGGPLQAIQISEFPQTIKPVMWKIYIGQAILQICVVNFIYHCCKIVSKPNQLLSI